MPATSTFLQPWLEPVLGRWLYADSGLWTVVGFLGAAIFGSRFVLQWLQSEKEKKLVVPWYFWHLSFWGSVLNLLYFLHLDKAPLILGNCFLPFLYGRNILFLRAGGEKGRGRLVFAAVAVLVVLGYFLSLLGSNASPARPPLFQQQYLKPAVIALRAYSGDMHALPSGDTRTVLRALTGENAQGVRYLDPPGEGLSAEGDWLDPWGHPIRIFISGKSILIRSAGPNGTFDDGDDEKRDDILVESAIP